MARGRKRKTGQRRNGRLVQPTQAERETNVKAVVMAQPHRLGSDDAMRECCVGRMIRDCWKDWFPHGDPTWTANDFYTVAMRYSEAYSAYQAVIASERPYANSAARGGEISPEQAQLIKREWSAVWRTFGGLRSPERDAADMVILDHKPVEWVAPFWVRHRLLMALTILAGHYIGTKRRAAA
jgi:hypothetical protein